MRRYDCPWNRPTALGRCGVLAGGIARWPDPRRRNRAEGRNSAESSRPITTTHAHAWEDIQLA